jgi:hypothetical protein
MQKSKAGLARNQNFFPDHSKISSMNYSTNIHSCRELLVRDIFSSSRQAQIYPI